MNKLFKGFDGGYGVGTREKFRTYKETKMGNKLKGKHTLSHMKIYKTVLNKEGHLTSVSLSQNLPLVS